MSDKHIICLKAEMKTLMSSSWSGADFCLCFTYNHNSGFSITWLIVRTGFYYTFKTFYIVMKAFNCYTRTSQFTFVLVQSSVKHFRWKDS